MIHASELRVGNIVNDEWTSVTSVHINGDVTLHRSSYHPEGEMEIKLNADRLESLVLSERILLRMLFEQNINDAYYFKDFHAKNSIAVKLDDLTKVYIYKMDFGHRISIVVMRDMPVHFFQNLYFMLTGTDCILEPFIPNHN